MADGRLPKADGGFVTVNRALDLSVDGISHRGPDDRDAITIKGGHNEVGFGHTRLSIIDLSPAGHQPMKDQATSNWITYNGEVYNYNEVRDLLGEQSEPWKSHSDTETILRSYNKWGRDCLTHLRGMFAFAIWDAAKHELFIARDRLGIKPVYYYSGEGFFIFASEIRALLATGLVPRKLDPIALSEYLTYQSVPAPRTLIKGVRALLPGNWLTVDINGRVTEKRYWDLLENASPDAKHDSLAEARKKVGQLLRESVDLHMVSDVPVGAFLSGGIDSSVIVALMRESGCTPNTFSVVFSEKNFDEAKFARQIAERFHTDHHEIPLSEQDMLDQLPDALAAMDHPTGDGINTYIVSHAVRKAGLKVALSGLGGDEFFAGYPSFKRLHRTAGYLRIWGNVPAGVRSLAAKTYTTVRGGSVAATKTAAILGTDGKLSSVFPLMREVLSQSQRRAILNDSFSRHADQSENPYSELLRNAFDGSNTAGTLTQVSYAEGRTYMHDVLLSDTDQMSMADALEVRVPLLDHKLVEYLMGVPDDHKRPNGIPKRLMIESLNGLIPDEIINRPKQGFTLPFDPWMRGAFRGFCEERLSQKRTKSRGIFRPNQVKNLWDGFLAAGRMSPGRDYGFWSCLRNGCKRTM